MLNRDIYWILLSSCDVTMFDSFVIIILKQARIGNDRLYKGIPNFEPRDCPTNKVRVFAFALLWVCNMFCQYILLQSVDLDEQFNINV